MKSISATDDSIIAFVLRYGSIAPNMLERLSPLGILVLTHLINVEIGLESPWENP